VRRNFPPEFVSADAERTWQAADVTADDPPVVDRVVLAGQYSALEDVWEGVMPLSHRHQRLAQQLRSVTGGNAHALLNAVQSVYHDAGVVPAPLRAAIVRVLADSEGLVLEGTAVDGSGREVFGVSTAADGQKTRLTVLFDPATAELTGHQEFLVRRAAKLDLELPGLLAFSERLAWGTTHDTFSQP
jgi:hypothetical protein